MRGCIALPAGNSGLVPPTRPRYPAAPPGEGASGGGEDGQIAAYRFIHTADIHLDSPLRSLALRDPELADLVGNATRRAFTGVIDLCLRERVDALLLAGDLYDGEQTSMKTARFLMEQLGRLHGAGIGVFIVRGNHDALSRITKELTFPDTVKVFGGRAEAVMAARARNALPVAIHGLSFAQPHAPGSLLGKYKAPVEGAANIGILHTSLAGAPGHDPYAPCGAAELQAAGYDYWALGHIHKRSVLEGRCKIVMPGMPQGRDVNESGPKSVSLVTVGEDRSIRIEERVTSLARFERITVDATGITDWAFLVREIGRVLERARDGLAAEHLIGRLRLAGTTPLAWRIRRDLDLLMAEARHRAGLIGSVSVEKLETECRPPGAEAGTPHDAAADNPVAELRRLIEEEILGSESFREKAAEAAEELRAQLPPECRTLLGAEEEAFRSAVAGLAQEGAEDVVARIHPAGAAEGETAAGEAEDS